MYILAEGPGIAPEKKNKKIKKKNNFEIFLAYKHPLGSPECPKIFLAQSVQPFGRLYATYINMNVLFYYIDYFVYL